MKTVVYSFRAAPGTVPAGMSAGDYVKSLAGGGAITAGAMVNTGARMVVNFLMVALFITVIVQWIRIVKLKKQVTG